MMRSIVAVAIVLSLAMLAEGRFRYKVDPVQWADYQSAVSSYGLRDSTPAKKGSPPDAKMLFHKPRFSVDYIFTGNCAEAGSKSYSYYDTRDYLANNNCKLNRWLNSTCSVLATVTCQTLPDFTAFVKNSGTLQTYAKNISHWWNVKVDDHTTGRAHKRDLDDALNAASEAKRAAFFAAKNESKTERQSPLPPYVWPGYPGLMNAQECYDYNEDQLYNLPQEARPRWHVQALSQNNGQVPTVNPFTKNSAYAGSTQGHIYIADSGIDGGHPEFIDANGLSRVRDVSIHDWIDPDAELWMGSGHDENGHGTAVAAFAAGKTLGVFPTAKIVNLKFYTSNLYDCYWDGGPAAPLASDMGLVNPAPANYPFYDDCGTYQGTYGYQSFVNAAQFALNEYNAPTGYRSLGEPAVFTTSAAPRWVVDWDGPTDDCANVGCMDSVTTVFQNMVTSGLIVVIAAGNEGIKLDSNYETGWDLGFYIPYVFAVPELVMVGGTNRNYGQATWDLMGTDDTDYDMTNTESTGCSNWGDYVDFWAPATGTTVYAMTHRVRHREIDLNPNNGPGWANPVYVPPYWKTNLGSGTSFAAPLVAAGLLMYQTTLPTITIQTNPLPATLAAAKEWAAPHYVTQFFDDLLTPAPGSPRPPSHVNYGHGDWVQDPRVIWSFRLIPSAEQYCPV